MYYIVKDAGPAYVFQQKFVCYFVLYSAWAQEKIRPFLEQSEKGGQSWMEEGLALSLEGWRHLTIEHAINLYQIIDIWNDGSLGIHVSSQTDFMAFYASLPGTKTLGKKPSVPELPAAAAAKWA